MDAMPKIDDFEVTQSTFSIRADPVQLTLSHNNSYEITIQTNTQNAWKCDNSKAVAILLDHLSNSIQETMVDTEGNALGDAALIWAKLKTDYKKKTHSQGFDYFSEMHKQTLPPSGHPGKSLECFSTLWQQMVGIGVDFDAIILYLLICKLPATYETLGVQHLNNIAAGTVTQTSITDLIKATNTHYEQRSLVSKTIGRKGADAHKMGSLKCHEGEPNHQRWLDVS